MYSCDKENFPKTKFSAKKRISLSKKIEKKRHNQHTFLNEKTQKKIFIQKQKIYEKNNI